MALNDKTISQTIALGMMSGTSMDGIDVALIASDGEGFVKPLGGASYPYEPEFRAALEHALEEAAQITERNQRPGNLNKIEAELTQRHAEIVAQFPAENPDLPEPDLIGFHGQTVLHRPEQGLTVQLGDGALLAQKTGIKTVYDMRANDMAYGGQGAPLAPAYHRALAAMLPGEFNAVSPVCFVNIGGISNITYIARGDNGNWSEPIAFDTGPGNALIDQFVAKKAGLVFDEGGKLAMAGRVNANWIAPYLTEVFFKKTPPKSLDRNDFFSNFQSNEITVEDGARSLARLTAEAIFRAKDHLPEMPALWIICGGGRHNRAIMADLDELANADGAQAISAEKAGFNGDLIEAEAWSYLAIRAVKNLPLSFPTTTGCREPVSGGVWT